MNPHIPEYALDHLSHVSIAGAMSVGRAAVAGMFMGQSTSTSTSACLLKLPVLTASQTRPPIGLSKSLLTPLNLVPSSWQFDLTLDLLQGGVLKVTGETLLMVLAEGHLDVKPTDSPSWVRVFATLSFSGGSQLDRIRSGGVTFSHRSNAPGDTKYVMWREGTVCPSPER